MAVGRLKHSIFEQASFIERQAFLKVSRGMSVDDVFKVFLDSYSFVLSTQLKRRASEMQEFGIDESSIMQSISPLLTDHAVARAAQVHDFAIRNDCYGFDLFQSCFPKVFSEVNISSRELGLKGIVDRVDLYRDHSIIYELKSGSPPREGVWSSHRMQVAAYSLLCRFKYNVPSRSCVVKYLGHSPREFVMNPFIESEVFEVRDKVRDLISKEQPPGMCARQACACQLLVLN